MQKKKSLHLTINVTGQPGCQCLVKGISLHVKTARAANNANIIHCNASTAIKGLILKYGQNSTEAPKT